MTLSRYELARIFQAPAKNQVLPLPVNSERPVVDVCPHCKKPVGIYLTTENGTAVEVARCETHGDVVPMRSAICN